MGSGELSAAVGGSVVYGCAPKTPIIVRLKTVGKGSPKSLSNT